MTSILSRANSAAISAERSARPSAQRYWMEILRPSLQPSSRNRCTKTAVHSSCEAGVSQKADHRHSRLLRPRSVRPRHRRAAEQRDALASDARPHSITAAAPPSRVMKSRRFRPITEFSSLAVWPSIIPAGPRCAAGLPQVEPARGRQGHFGR